MARSDSGFLICKPPLSYISACVAPLPIHQCCYCLFTQHCVRLPDYTSVVYHGGRRFPLPSTYRFQCIHA